MNKKLNIIFIIIDAVRARNLGCYGYDKPTSTNIDRLAENGVLFEDAYSTTNATDPSLTTIFNGRYPLSHGVINHGHFVTRDEVIGVTRLPSLPKILKNHGYRTLAVDWLDRWHKNGYDYYSGELSRDIKSPTAAISRFGRWLYRKISIRQIASIGLAFMPRLNIYDDAKKVTEHAQELLKSCSDQPFFLFLHFWDPHVPYNPPQEYWQRFHHGFSYGYVDKSPAVVLNQIVDRRLKRHYKDWMQRYSNLDEVLAGYDGELSFVDTYIGRLIQTLDSYNLRDKTMIVLTSDHGESLLEHGIYFEHHGLYDVNIHVPLIMTCPPLLPKGKRVRGFVQHVDILPTILDMLDIPAINGLDGNSLLNIIHNQEEWKRSFIYAEEAYTQRKRAIRTQKYKYIEALIPQGAMCRYCGTVHGGLYELYDIEKDPGEMNNIADQRKDVTSELKKELDRVVRKYSGRQRTEERAKEQLTQTIRKLKREKRL